jgi:predicted MFS family arabinose efflux permease
VEQIAEVKKTSVFEGVTGYHWVIVIIASCGWLFDCMDQRIFILAREPAIRELMGAETAAETIKDLWGWATCAMLIGWATGGIIFGMMSDKWGRVKTMVVTLIVYSGFTGLSGIAQSVEAFIAYRFLVGLGVGGMFGAATTLVAESVPGNFRSIALGSLQALSACGNIFGSLISLAIPPGSEDYLFGMSGWRVIFFVGVIPSILIVPIVFILREPEPWKQAKKLAADNKTDQSKQIGSIADLFRTPRWRRNTLVGVTLGFAGMGGLWGIGFYSPELISAALKGESQQVIDSVRGWGTALQDVGAFLGMFTFTLVATFISRRLAFLGAFILCLIITPFVFFNLNSASDAYWMLPMMGFAHLSLFGGYSIYFPEIFPTRLRGTGVGFCYNTVRYLAAGVGPLMMAFNHVLVSRGVNDVSSFRWAASMMTGIYLIGILALVWAPETKGQPLPED